MAFSRVDVLAAVSVAMERLVYQQLSADQEQDVLHSLTGHDIFLSFPTGLESLCSAWLF